MSTDSDPLGVPTWRSNLSLLGEVRDTFQPNPDNILAGTIIGWGLILGGFVVAACLFLSSDRSVQDSGDFLAKYGSSLFFGIVGPIVGEAVLLWMRRLRSHRVVIGRYGLGFVYAGKTDSFTWFEVSEIREILEPESLMIAAGVSYKKTARKCEIICIDGRDFRFTVNSINDIDRLAAVLLDISQEYGIAWNRIQL